MGVYLHMMEGRAFIQRDHCHLHLGHLKLLCKMRGLVLVEAKGIAGAIVFVLKTHPKFLAGILYVMTYLCLKHIQNFVRAFFMF